jgi:hypothetical protein
MTTDRIVGPTGGFEMAMSWGQKQMAIQKAAEGLFPNAKTCWIDEIYDGEVVFCVYPKGDAVTEWPESEYWKSAYTVAEDGTVTFSGELARVRRETNYVAFAEAKYVWERGADGKYRIMGVPIFQACTAFGETFDEGWIDRAIRKFEELKAKRWFPKVIIGHTAPGVERPVEGYLDNMKRIGNVLFADMAGLAEDLFLAIKDGKWPDRSIEGFYGKAQVNALALLGGSSPYHKLDQIRGFGEGAESRWFVWGRGPVNPQEREEVPVAGEAKTTPAPTPGAEPVKFSESPEYQAMQARLAAQEEELRQGRVRMFREEMKGLGLAPAVLDSPEFVAFAEDASRSDRVVKFSETESASGLSALGKLVRRFAEQAEKKAFLAPPVGEVASVTTTHPDAGPTEEQKRVFGETAEGFDEDAAVKALREKDPKLGYTAALEKVRAAKRQRV